MPYSGQFGDIPYDDPWWKVLLALIAAVLALLGGAEEAAQAAYEDEDLTFTVNPDLLLEAYVDIDVPFISGPDGNQVNVRRHCFLGR